MKFNSIISAVKHAGKQNVYNSYKAKKNIGLFSIFIVLFIHRGEDKKYSHVKFSSSSIKVFQAWNTSFQHLFFTTFSFM
jgi:hypothetical protein